MILITGAVANSNEDSVKLYEEMVKICKTKSNNILPLWIQWHLREAMRKDTKEQCNW